MTRENINWTISLSLVSMMGPTFDIQALKLKGFYKHKKSAPDMEISMDITSERYKEAAPSALEFMEIFGIKNRKNYIDTLEELIKGSELVKNMDALFRLAQLMPYEQRQKKRSFFINGHLYLYDLFEALLAYENHWPKNGLIAFELANAMMLVRLGATYEYIDYDAQLKYTKQIQDKAILIFQDYETFGSDVIIGTRVFIDYMALVHQKKLSIHMNYRLSMAFFSVWQYIPSSKEL